MGAFDRRLFLELTDFVRLSALLDPTTSTSESPFHAARQALVEIELAIA